MFTFLCKLHRFICNDCYTRLKYAEDNLKNVYEEYEKLLDQKNFFQTRLDELKASYKKLERKYNELNKKPELPEELYETDNIYRGQRVLYYKDGKFTYTLPKLQDYFLVSRELIQTQIKLARITDSDSDYDKFVKAVKYVQTHYRYKYDRDEYGYEENWEPIENVIHTGVGDCESLSMLAVMIARYAGVPANKVFMAVGLYYAPDSDQVFGHAWPVFKQNVWYVGEATNYSPIRRWEDVKVKYHALWGLGNDVFSCKIKGDKDYPG